MKKTEVRACACGPPDYMCMCSQAYIFSRLTCVTATVIDCVCAGVSVLRLISLTAGKCCLTAPLAASPS